MKAIKKPMKKMGGNAPMTETMGRTKPMAGGSMFSGATGGMGGARGAKAPKAKGKK